MKLFNSGTLFIIEFFLAILGGIGIVAIFLPFTWSTSPFSAALEKDLGLWKIALPAFLPVIIPIASLRWLFATTLSKPERAIAYFASAIGAVIVCITLSGIATNLEGWPTNLIEWLSIIIPLVTLGVGLFTLFRTRKNLIVKPFLPIMMLQIIYLADCLLCLISFFGEWQIGAYLSLVTAIAYLTQIILVFKNSGRA